MDKERMDLSRMRMLTAPIPSEDRNTNSYFTKDPASRTPFLLACLASEDVVGLHRGPNRALVDGA